MFAFASSIVVLIMSGFAIASAAIIYHLNRYGVPGDRTPLLRRVFLIGNAVFFLLALLLFFAVPWQTLSIR